MGNTIRIGALVITAIIVIGGIVFRDRISGGADSLAVGDCIDLPTANEFQDVQHHPCNEPHQGEVFVVQDYANPPDALPSEAEFKSWVQTYCLGQAFTDYTGKSFEAASDIDVGYFVPTSDGWGRGDKEMVCYLAPIDGGTVSASYRKAS